MDARIQSLLFEEQGLRIRQDFDGALRVLDEILAIDPSNSYALNNKAAIFLMRHSYSDALPVLEKAVEADPSNGQAFNNLGLALQKTGNLERALQCLKCALELGYTHQGVRRNLSWAYFGLGKVDEALDEWQCILRADPLNKLVLGDVYQLARAVGATVEDRTEINESIFPTIRERLQHCELIISPPNNEEETRYVVVPKGVNPGMVQLLSDYRSLYVAASAKGKEPDWNYVNGVNADFSVKLSDFRNAAKHLGYALPENIFIGTFPVRSLNAQVVPRPAGTLMLVNDMLMGFVLSSALLVAGTVPASSKGQELPKAFSSTDARCRFLDNIELLLRGGEISSAECYPGDKRLPFAEWLFVKAVDFVIAHELAHVLNGDIDLRMVLEPTAQSAINAHHEDWQIEFRADELGQQLLIAANQKDDPGRLCEGPTLFFALSDIVSRVARREGSANLFSYTSTHPPAESRIMSVMTAAKVSPFDDRTPRLDGIINAVQQLSTK